MNPDGHLVPITEEDQGEGWKDPVELRNELNRLMELENIRLRRFVGKQRNKQRNPSQR